MKKILIAFILLITIVLPANAGNVVTMFKTQGADVTAPTVSTATIGTNGTTLTLGMSETVTRSGGTFDVDCATAGSGLTCTYASGSGSNSLVYTIGTTVNNGDTCDLDYNGAANGVEDGAGNDLAAITSQAVTNNSTQGVTFPINGVLETFTGSNSTSPPNANWSSVYNNIQIQDNAATGPAGDFGESYYNVTTYGPDFEAYVTVSTKGGTSSGFRLEYITSFGDYQGFSIELTVQSGTDIIKVYRYNSTDTQLGADISQEVSDGDSIGFSREGSTITVWYKAGAGSWTNLTTRTDSNYQTAGNITLGIVENAWRLDNLGGGSL